MGTLIELTGASVALQGREVLHDLHWRLENGENWAVLGGNGAGKSTFLRLIGGQIWPRPHHSRQYHLGEKPTWSPLSARDAIALLSPEAQNRTSRLLRDGPDLERGLQLTGRDAILTGFFDSDLLHQTPATEQEMRADELAAHLDLTALAARPLSELSQGQLRRILLARALVKKPRILLLDEACSGLDRAARHQMLEIIDRIGREGTQIISTTHREAEIVPCINRVLRLDGGRIVANRHRLENEGLHQAAPRRGRTLAGHPDRTPFIELRNADVYLDGTQVLHDLNWVWRPGEHWAVGGANGAGKSTFVRLLRGELWPAFGGVIRRFGSDAVRPAWEMAAEIGLVSPALQARYSEELPVEAAIGSGFSGRLGASDPLDAAQRERVAEVMAQCGLEPLAGRTFGRLSYGQTRKVLLARALVTRPQLLLLDEALDGLDTGARAEWLEILSHLAAEGTGLLVVSHHEEDWPPMLTHHLHLEGGRIGKVEGI